MLGIRLVKHLFVLHTQGQVVHLKNLIGHILVGVVHRIHDAVHPHNFLSKADGGLPRHARGGVPKILTQIVAGQSLQGLNAGASLGTNDAPVHKVNAVVPIRQAFAQVTQDHFEFWEAIKKARHDEP